VGRVALNPSSAGSAVPVISNRRIRRKDSDSVPSMKREVIGTENLARRIRTFSPSLEFRTPAPSGGGSALEGSNANDSDISGDDEVSVPPVQSIDSYFRRASVGRLYPCDTTDWSTIDDSPAIVHDRG